jgi:hypothetical protein
MGAAAYNRGTRVIEREADGAMAGALARANDRAYQDEIERLRVELARRDRDLVRARRCIAELRRSKEVIVSRARNEQRGSDLAIGILCRKAFLEDG